MVRGLYKQTDNGCYCLNGMKRTDGTAVNVDIHGVAVTDCRDRISEAKNHAAARSKKLASSMCIRMHARRFARTTRISRRDEPAQWQLSRGPTHVLHDANASEAQRGGPCLLPTSLILSLEPMFYLDRIYARVQQASWFSCKRAPLGLGRVYTRVQQLINWVLCHRRERVCWLPNDPRF